MKIKAKFIGQDVSMGFVKNEAYELEITASQFSYNVILVTYQTSPISQVNVPYANILTFLQNWTNIQTI